MNSLFLAMLATGSCLVAPVAAQEANGYGFLPRPYRSSEVTIGVLLDDPAARSVIERYAPALLDGGGLTRSRDITLAQLHGYAPGLVSAETLAQIDVGLAALAPTPEALAEVGRATIELAAARLDPAQPWITTASAFGADFDRDPIALQFRRDLTFAVRPQRLRVHISADNRFILYVNGVRVAAGPARGDLDHWRYEIVDLAPYLRAGANVIAAQVWNDGAFAPLAQLSSGHTGFMLKAEEADDAEIDTGTAWRVRVDPSRSVTSGMSQVIASVGPTFYVGGAPETLDGALMNPDWASLGADIEGWSGAIAAVTRGANARTLVPDLLPPMRYETIPSGRVVRAKGVDAGSFPNEPLTVPPNTEATVLVDAGRVLAAYPALVTHGGAGSIVEVVYTEALYDPAQPQDQAPGSARPRFHDRSTVADGLALGLTDRFRVDGDAQERFAPFWWRAWRFVEIKVKTGDAPLTLERFETHETGYPFVQRGYFNSNDAALNEVWRIGWMTGLLDAHETYMDTAYWEQLQYIGDTRVQALLSYDVAGDPKLAVQALEAFDRSRILDGLPQAAWPLDKANPIPPFALLWIGMAHDFWMRQPDTDTVRGLLPGIRAVLDWYVPNIGEDGLVRATPGWLFIDWRTGLDGGRDRTGNSPPSCVISLLAVGALREAADLESALSDPDRAVTNRATAERVASGVRSQCWDSARGLFADTPAKTTFSQHANALAVLYDVAPKADQQSIIDRITVPDQGIDAPAGVTGTTFYFSFYLARAMVHAGLGDRYLDLMKTWRDLRDQNLTTWPENPDPGRSDSHAWTAHPTSGLLNYVAGIQPAAPGFAMVDITPHLGKLTDLDAAMAHPAGLIRVQYHVTIDGVTADIDLPPGLSGTFSLSDRQWPLATGRNRVVAAHDQKP